MSVQLAMEVLRCSRAPAAARHVLQTIALHHHHEDPTRTVALLAEQLGEETGLGRSQLYDHLKTLQALGELVKLEGGGGRGKATKWRIPAFASERETMRRWRTPQKPSARPLVATVKASAPPDASAPEIPSAEPDGIGVNRPVKRPVNSPEDRTVPSRVKAVGKEGEEEEPPNPQQAGGSEAQNPPEGEPPPSRPLRALGTNPRAVAARRRHAEELEAAAATVAEHRSPDQADEPDWLTFLTEVRKAVNETTWNIWLSNLSLIAVDQHGSFIVSAEDSGWVESRFTRVLQACAVATGRPGARVATGLELEALRVAAA